MARSAAARTDGTVAQAITVPVNKLRPNPWNPNRMDEAMLEKERASIEKFGFVDPLTVREDGYDGFQVIDGEHRLIVARQMGYKELPCWNLGIIEDDDARELTVVLNETRGRYDQGRLRELLQDLISRRGEEPVREIMPFDRSRFDEIMGRMAVDWNKLEERRQEVQQAKFKELVFRMPYDDAKVVEETLKEVRDREGFDHEWQALHMICVDVSR